MNDNGIDSNLNFNNFIVLLYQANKINQKFYDKKFNISKTYLTRADGIPGAANTIETSANYVNITLPGEHTRHKDETVQDAESRACSIRCDQKILFSNSDFTTKISKKQKYSFSAKYPKLQIIVEWISCKTTKDRNFIQRTEMDTIESISNTQMRQCIATTTTHCTASIPYTLKYHHHNLLWSAKVLQSLCNFTTNTFTHIWKTLSFRNNLKTIIFKLDKQQSTETLAHVLNSQILCEKTYDNCFRVDCESCEQQQQHLRRENQICSYSVRLLSTNTNQIVTAFVCKCNIFIFHKLMALFCSTFAAIVCSKSHKHTQMNVFKHKTSTKYCEMVKFCRRKVQLHRKSDTAIKTMNIIYPRCCNRLHTAAVLSKSLQCELIRPPPIHSTCIAFGSAKTKRHQMTAIRWCSLTLFYCIEMLLTTDDITCNLFAPSIKFNAKIFGTARTKRINTTSATNFNRIYSCFRHVMSRIGAKRIILLTMIMNIFNRKTLWKFFNYGAINRNGFQSSNKSQSENVCASQLRRLLAAAHSILSKFRNLAISIKILSHKKRQCDPASSAIQRWQIIIRDYAGKLVKSALLWSIKTIDRSKVVFNYLNLFLNRWSECDQNKHKRCSSAATNSNLIDASIILQPFSDTIRIGNNYYSEKKTLPKYWKLILTRIKAFKLTINVVKVVLTILLATSAPQSTHSFHHNIKYSMNVVKTKYGPIRGIIYRQEPLVEAYLGVPFASPPVGGLRYMPPVTPSTWKNTKLADRFSPVCPQSVPQPPNGPEALLEVPRGRLAQLRRLLPLLTNQSEDCLYLNLYVPRALNPGSASPPSPTSYGGDIMSTVNLSSLKPDGLPIHQQQTQQQQQASYSNTGGSSGGDSRSATSGNSDNMNSGSSGGGSGGSNVGNSDINNDDSNVNNNSGGNRINIGNSGSATQFTNGGYTNLNDDPSQNKPLPAIVYIHGESYEWNSGNPYDGSVLAAHGNVIVVTLNFRLGVLGFLKTGGKTSAQGNFGLMDLVAGLHWLRENLPAFGGDPKKVTVMGHGTGAALANILVVSPVASDLIHRAILLSGSALSPWAIQKDPLLVKRRVAEHTGCHGDLLVDDLAPCLRTKSIEELLQIKIDQPRFLPGFAPFIDGTVIAHSSASITRPLILPIGSAIASTSGLEFADFPERELIFGLTSIESYLDLSAQDLEFGFNETRRDRILRTYVRNVYHYHLNEIFSVLKNEYTDWEKTYRSPLTSRDATLEFLSDGHTAAPLIRLGYLHSIRGGRTYFMHFRHQTGEREFPQRYGSIHGEDIAFWFGLPISPMFPYNYTKQDIRQSKVMIRYLANFAMTGNPNENTLGPIDISHNILHGVKNSKFLESSSLTLSSSMVNASQAQYPNSTPEQRRKDAQNTMASNQNAVVKSNLQQTNHIRSTATTLVKHHDDQYFKQQYHHITPFQSEEPRPSVPLTTFISEGAAMSTTLQYPPSPSSPTFSGHHSTSALNNLTQPNNSQSYGNNYTYRILNQSTPIIAKQLKNKFFVNANDNPALSKTSSGMVMGTLPTNSITSSSESMQRSRRHVQFFQSFSNKVFKRRKRKTSKRSQKRKRLGFNSINSTSSSSTLNGSHTNSFFRKRYENGFHSASKNGNLNQKFEKQIRHGSSNMQNDQGAFDDDDDDEDDDHDVDEDDDDDDEDDDNFGRSNRLGGGGGGSADKNNNNNNAANNFDEDSSSSSSSTNGKDGEKFDRFTDDFSNYHLPFWDTYDTINQLYLDLGNKAEIRNHYRGHKLSMWLNLIPQLHSPGNLNDLPMRHHHFAEDSAQYYDGIIRPQITQRPFYAKSNTPAPQHTSTINPILTTTECLLNTTVVPTIAATRPQNHQQNGSAPVDSETKSQENTSLLHRITNSQSQSYTTALVVTISVGCFLLLLNLLIFAGIYYQRERRISYIKQKEELRKSERCASPILISEKLDRPGCSGDMGKNSRKSSLQSLTGFNSSGSFGEYSCYDEKIQCKEKHSLADICSVELPMKEYKSSTSPNSSNTGSLRRNQSMSPQQPQQQQSTGLLIYPPSYHNQGMQHHNPTQKVVYPAAVATAAAVAVVEQAAVVPPASDPSSGLVTYSQFHKQMQQHVHHQHSHHQHSHQHMHRPLLQSLSMGASTDSGSNQMDQMTQSDTQKEIQAMQNGSTNCGGGGGIDEKTVVVMVSGTASGSGDGLLNSSNAAQKKLETGSNCSGSSSMSTSVAGSGLTITCESNNENDDVDIQLSPGIPEPPPPPKSTAPYQGGILRQPGPPTTPGTNKKRVQIQEISV